MSTQLPEKFDKPVKPLDESSSIASDLMLHDISTRKGEGGCIVDAMTFTDKIKKAEYFSPEITISDNMRVTNFRLPGNASLDLAPNKNGERQMVLGYTDPSIKTFGPHDTVTVGADGSITTDSILPNRRFATRQDGDRTTITMPTGDQVVVQGGRIVEATTGGRTTEFLTPEQAENREAEREAKREAQRQAYRRETEEQAKTLAGKLSDQLVNGNIPVDALRKAFTDMSLVGVGSKGYHGDIDGPMLLARALNADLRSQGSDTRVIVYRDIESGDFEVRVRTPQGAVTTIPIEYPWKKVTKAPLPTVNFYDSRKGN